MRLYRRMDIPEISTKLGSVDTRASAALALVIIILLAQIVMAICLFMVWKSGRTSRRPADPERGVELQSRGVPTRDTVRRPPQAHTQAAPVGPSPAQAHGRPVAAYVSEQTHGENEDYYDPQPISSRRPTWTADSGRGEQTQGTNYSDPRNPRNKYRSDEGHHNTNRPSQANYGKRGNKFAHGT